MMRLKELTRIDNMKETMTINATQFLIEICCEGIISSKQLQIYNNQIFEMGMYCDSKIGTSPYKTITEGDVTHSFMSMPNMYISPSEFKLLIKIVIRATSEIKKEESPYNEVISQFKIFEKKYLQDKLDMLKQL